MNNAASQLGILSQQGQALANQGLTTNQGLYQGQIGQAQNCVDWNPWWVQPTVQWYSSPCYMTHLQTASTADIVAELKRRLADAEKAAAEAPKLKTLITAIEASGIK